VRAIRQARWPALALAVALAIGSNGCGRALVRQPNDRVVAIVNGEKLMQSELDAAIVLLRAIPRVQVPPPSEVFSRAVLEKMIDRQLVLQEAAHAGISASEFEVELYWPEVLERYGEKSVSDLEGKLRAIGVNVTAFKREVKEDASIKKLLRRRVYTRVSVTDAEIDAYLAERGHTSNDQEFARRDIREVIFRQKYKAQLDSLLYEIRQRATIEVTL
jgi:peptidyl-prolyl cis-trans isomerase SurA